MVVCGKLPHKSGTGYDERARQTWLACFERTLEGADVKYNFPLEHLQGFKDFLKSFSAWMVNKA